MTDKIATPKNDIADMFDAQAFALDIKSPRTGEPIGFRIMLQSTSSPAVRAVRKRWSNAVLKLGAKSKSLDADQVEEMGLDQLVAATTGWEFVDPTLTLDGGRPSFTPDAARSLYKKYTMIAAQVDTALDSDANFIKG